MAPMRKSRSVNKRFSYPSEVSPVKDVDSIRSRQRKRKLSDMLGPQWTKEELQCFYEAYRKHGKDWKKVASSVHNRTMEMVEALYTMNRAYLSLPEGTASVVGLIAMMTDHYSVLEGSDSEQESNDGVETSQKPQKLSRGKLHSSTSKEPDGHFADVSHSQTAAFGYGCLSLLKKKHSGGSQTRAVGKRTPRFPVRYTYDKDSKERYLSPARQGLRFKVDAAAVDVAHEVALALAEASNRGCSPQVSDTQDKKRKVSVPSPARLAQRMYSESEMNSAKDVELEMDENGLEGSLGSMEADNGDFPKERSCLGGRRAAGASSVQRKGKKLYGKKLEGMDVGAHHVEDIKEACSVIGGGQKISSVKRKLGTGVADATVARSPGPQKRSKKVLFGGDEGSAFDALQTLADLSLMMPATTTETAIPPDEEKVSLTNKSMVSEAIHAREKSKVLLSKKKREQSVVSAQGSKSKAAKPGKIQAPDVSAVPEAKDTGIREKKQKSPTSKISTSEIHVDADTNEINKKKAPAKRQVNLLTKAKSKRKMDKAEIVRNSQELNIAEAFVKSQSNASLHACHERALGSKLQERLANCLSNYHARRWCVFEWFYSAIDYPWFAKSEFVEYLYHVELGHVPRLTHVEWGVLRSSLGKPRRFSEQFLKDEREKLNYYRECVRNHYTELRNGTREGLPTDLARPLTVGQHVIALHPRTRELHNGSVLTVDHNRCRVQFDQPELGVEFVMDIYCMPLNPAENMPASLKLHHTAVGKFYKSLKQLKTSKRADERKKEEYINFAPNQKAESANGPLYLTNSSLKQGKEGLRSPSPPVKVGPDEVVSPQQVLVCQPSNAAQILGKEADVQALAELARSLDKKNALVTELKRMNDDVIEDSSLKDLDSFKKQYAALLVQLDEVFEQVSSALICLRQQNTYHGNSPLPWQKQMAFLNDRGSLVASFDHLTCDSQGSESHVSEIVETSRLKARKMIDAAMQAVSSFKEGGNSIEKIEDAMDYVNNHLSLDDSGMPAPASRVHGSVASHNQLNLCESNHLTTNHASDSKSDGESYEPEPEIPSELIANCVATLLMIQKCTERQSPPSDVAQILDFAVTSLQPCCSQNLAVYGEIQKCMGIIRSQILALVPT